MTTPPTPPPANPLLDRAPADTTHPVIVLAGGPDRERPVSLQSGQQVTHALTTAGFHTLLRDATPDNLSALDEAATLNATLFPVLHGPWGEGGPLQHELESRNLTFVGSGSAAARLGMDKLATKQALRDAGLPTPDFQPLTPGDPLTLEPPLVLKPLAEGSSFGVSICHDRAAIESARDKLHPEFGSLLAERFIAGKEITAGVLSRAHKAHALPLIWIRLIAEFYDFEAKYEREDTQYDLDPLPPKQADDLQKLAIQTHQLIGAQHLSRVDFILSEEGPQILEINTLPGFTSHSLLPKAAAHAGLSFPELAAWLVAAAQNDARNPPNIPCTPPALCADPRP
ncbi:MAG: D-alanine--D-alanine ligase [Phycisphaeraceae bacterium]